MNEYVKNSGFKLDAFDRAILNLVQQENKRPHSEIGNLVGLSESAVRRRLAVLREEGVISRDVSLLSPSSFGVTLIVQISFLKDSVEAYEAFDHQMENLPNVRQSYHVSGSSDYILVVHGPSLQWYEDWAKSNIMSNANIGRHETAVAWSCKKFETAISV